VALDTHAAVPCVGVVPGHELARRRRLFDALSASFEVAFTPRDRGAFRSLDAAVIFAGPTPPDVPSLVLAPSARRGPSTVLLHDTPGLDPRLRGRTLGDRRAAGTSLAAERGDRLSAAGSLRRAGACR